MGGRNGSCRLTGLWQTVRGASSPITAQTIATDDQRNTQPQDEGDGYRPGAGRMTTQRTIRPRPEPKVSVILALLMSELYFKQARPHRWEGKCCFTALVFHASVN